MEEQLKTDNLCCPRIGPDYIKGISYVFPEEETIATAIARD